MIVEPLFNTAVVTFTIATVAITNTILYNKFATKTTYNASLINDSTPYDVTDTYDTHHCHPVQVNVVLRHGIRYPSAEDVEATWKIIHEFRRQGAKHHIVRELEKVLQRHLPADKDKKLAVTGEIEQQEIGFRLGDDYRKLFESAGYDDVIFAASKSERTVHSCKSFQKGFVEQHGLNVTRDIHVRDDLLRFFSLCPRYIKEVRKNESAFIEQIYFQEKINKKVVRDIAKYLDVSELHIDPDDVMSIYKIAACEVAIVGTHHWADLLRLTDFNLLQYCEDLEEYWKYSYGHSINYLQSCPLLADIFRHMDDVVNGTRSTKGAFYFGHAETLMPLMTLLGLFKDNDTLRADNYHEQKHRIFVTSHLLPFSTNLAFTLYKCNSTDNDYRLQLSFKERPIRLPLDVCPSSGLCRYSIVRKHYAQYIDGCDFNATCSINDVSTGSTSEPAILVLMFSFGYLFYILIYLVHF